MKTPNYRIVTNGVKFKVQRRIPWYECLPFGKWGDASWEWKTKEDAQQCLELHIKQDMISSLKWRAL